MASGGKKTQTAAEKSKASPDPELGHEVLLWERKNILSSTKKGAEAGLLKAIPLIFWTKGGRLVENIRKNMGRLTVHPPLAA